MESTPYREKLRSLSLQARRTSSKQVTHVTDTAVVTETHRDDGQDTNVRLLEPARFLPPKEAS